MKNSPELDYTKEQIEGAILSTGQKVNVRGEALTLEEFAQIANYLTAL